MELNSTDIPSMNNIYESKYWDKVRNEQQTLSDNLYKKSKNPFISGVVSRPSYASAFGGNDDVNSAEFPSLTGNNINIANFKHNNMQPFLKKNVTQNTSDIQTTKLQMNTGNDMYYKNKKEIENFFTPTESYTYQNDFTDKSIFLKERTNISKIQNNTSPIESVKVGAGLGLGYTSEGSGGFQQSSSLDYAMPKSLDELRTKINQKNSTYEIPFQGPSKMIDKRADATPFDKNKPERVYTQTEDNWFKTTGSILKETDRPIENVKATSRINTHIDYSGPTNIQISSGIDDTYGKNSIIVYNNERQLTETRTVQTNLTSSFKAFVAPILDALKITNKSYLVEAARGVGNPSIQIPEKATLYDPISHVMKTTIKETTIHDSQVNNLTGPDGTYSTIEDQARTTTKETTIHDSQVNNLTGPDGTYSTVEDQARTTTKETIIHDSQVGNLTSIVNATYADNDDKTKTTIRQTMKAEDNTRNIGGVIYKIQVYNTEEVAKTTVKQTTVKSGGSMMGFLGGILEGLMGGYLNTNYDPKNTQKQFTSDCENYGIAGSKEKFSQMDRTSVRNAEIDGTREMLLINAGDYIPPGGGKYAGTAKEDIRMDTNKKQIDLEESTRLSNNISRIYQSRPGPIEDANIPKKVFDDFDYNNAYNNRLDNNILSSLKSNDLNISINPI